MSSLQSKEELQVTADLSPLHPLKDILGLDVLVCQVLKGRKPLGQVLPLISQTFPKEKWHHFILA